MTTDHAHDAHGQRRLDDVSGTIGFFPGGDMVDVSVVIPALNEEANIAAAVNSALTAGAKQVVVGDGGSHDSTVVVAEQAGAVVVRSEPGRAKQQNVAAAASSGDYLLFLHADNRLAKTAIQQLQAACEHQPICGAFQQQIEAPGWKFRLLEAGNAARVRWFGAAYGDQAIFVQRRLFDAVGGFPDVRLMEDVLLMRELKKNGWPVLLPGPVVISARRWIQHGVLRQTLRNFCLVTALKLGASPNWLANFYSRHDENL